MLNKYKKRDRWMARHGDGCLQGCDEDTCKAKALLKVMKPTAVATTLSISRAVDNHLATKYSK